MGNNCRHWDECNDLKDEQTEFDCSSIAFGNAFLAAKEICSGENWEEIENWTESLDQYYERMTKFTSRLNGPRRISHRDQGYYFDGNGIFHDNCSRSDDVLERVRQIYRAASVGLDLMTLGNHVYRTPVISGDNTEK